MRQTLRGDSHVLATDDIDAIHLKTVHECGRKEIRWYENSNSQYLDYFDPRAPNKFFSAGSRGETVVPSPDIFLALQGEECPKEVTDLPTTSECAVHLELLEAVYALRRRVISTQNLDDSFGIKGPTRTVYRRTYVGNRKYEHRPFAIKDKTFPERSQKKWTAFLHIAVMRFITWAEKVEGLMQERGGPHENAYLPYLPPLDVLTVWHAFLLNPGTFRRHCEVNVLPYLKHVSFPWTRIHKAISTVESNAAYNLPAPARAWFTETTGMPPDLYEYIQEAGTKDSEAPIRQALAKFCDDNATGIPNIGFLIKRTKEEDDPEQHAFMTLLLAAQNQRNVVKPLADNVVRQGGFVDKMHHQLWLRSPAFADTLRRSVERYDNFTQLFKLKPKSTLVPTLDMDLAWHTHQLSHARYKAAMEEITGRFIDHDDKIGSGTLSVWEGYTRNEYEIVFGEEYSRCLCWDCEAMLSALEQDESPSIEGDWAEGLVEKIREDLQFYRCVEVCRRMGNRLVARTEEEDS